MDHIIESIDVNYPLLSFLREKDIQFIFENFRGIYSQEDLEPIFLVAHLVLSFETSGPGPGTLNQNQLNVLNFIIKRSNEHNLSLKNSPPKSKRAKLLEEQDKEYEEALTIDSSSSQSCVEKQNSNEIEEQNSNNQTRRELNPEEMRKARLEYFSTLLGKG